MNTIKPGRTPQEPAKSEESKEWDNPTNPEATEDQRDVEQLQRQLEEAKRRKENLSDPEETN